MGKGLLDLEKYFVFYGAYHSNRIKHSHPYGVCLANLFHSSSYALFHALSAQPPHLEFFLFGNHFCSGFEFWVLVSFYLFCVLRLFGCESWVLGYSALCYLLDC